MTIPPGVVGIDISKQYLDVFDPRVGRVERLANGPAEIADLAERLSAVGDRAVFEATGVYDRALGRGLAAAGVRFSRVNPSQARSFAKAAGFLAKTDGLDARMLSAMGRALDLRPAAPADPTRERLGGLHRRRDQLVLMRGQERTRLKDCAQDDETRASLDEHLAWLDTQIRRLERRIAELIAQNAELASAERRLRSVPGVGPVTAATLLVLAPELGRRSPKTIAALAGLAPFNSDSGLRRGHRAIRGGRKRLRDALYMAAVTAARSNSRFKAFYQTLVKAGKPAKLALIALARKLLVTLNAIERDQTAFQP